MGKLRRKSWTNTRWKTAREKLTKKEVLLRSGVWYEEARYSSYASGLKTAGQESPRGSEYNLQRKQSMQAGSTKEEEMKQQQSMKAMKDMKRETKAKGRVDASSGWWVCELLAADCEKAWLHFWDGNILCRKWYDWLCDMKRRMEQEEERGEPETSQPNDQECRWKRRALASQHKTLARPYGCVKSRE